LRTLVTGWAWLKPAHRCLVPVTSFSEYADTKPRKTPVWFALDERLRCQEREQPVLLR
jgi:putative SOS response-associated peptidase YedK